MQRLFGNFMNVLKANKENIIKYGVALMGAVAGSLLVRSVIDGNSEDGELLEEYILEPDDDEDLEDESDDEEDEDDEE